MAKAQESGPTVTTERHTCRFDIRPDNTARHSRQEIQWTQLRNAGVSLTVFSTLEWLGHLIPKCLIIRCVRFRITLFARHNYLLNPFTATWGFHRQCVVTCFSRGVLSSSLFFPLLKDNQDLQEFILLFCLSVWVCVCVCVSVFVTVLSRPQCCMVLNPSLITLPPMP